MTAMRVAFQTLDGVTGVETLSLVTPPPQLLIRACRVSPHFQSGLVGKDEEVPFPVRRYALVPHQLQPTVPTDGIVDAFYRELPG